MWRNGDYLPLPSVNHGGFAGETACIDDTTLREVHLGNKPKRSSIIYVVRRNHLKPKAPIKGTSAPLRCRSLAVGYPAAPLARRALVALERGVILFYVGVLGLHCCTMLHGAWADA